MRQELNIGQQMIWIQSKFSCITNNNIGQNYVATRYITK
jgi:hypothetical protein